MLDRYNQILGAVQELSPSAHIAGGAVRDTLLDRPIRDIDLFLADENIEAAAGLMRSKFGFVKVGEWTRYEEFSDPLVARLAKFEKADESIPVCLIGLKGAMNMRHNVTRFDFGICMCAWTGRDFFLADGYKRDRDSKSFTLLRADNLAQFGYSMRRYTKLSADRYSGWGLNISNEFADLLKEYTYHKEWYLDDTPLGLGGPQVLRQKDR